MKEKYITGLLNKYAGIRDIAVADLSVYLNNPVGVGDHSDIGVEIEKKINVIKDCDDVIKTIQKYFTKEESITGEPITDESSTSDTSD